MKKTLVLILSFIMCIFWGTTTFAGTFVSPSYVVDTTVGSALKIKITADEYDTSKSDDEKNYCRIEVYSLAQGGLKVYSKDFEYTEAGAVIETEICPVVEGKYEIIESSYYKVNGFINWISGRKQYLLIPQNGGTTTLVWGHKAQCFNAIAASADNKSGIDASDSNGLTDVTGASDVITPVAGDTIISSNVSYMVLTAGRSGNTVQYTGTTSTAKTVKIPATVTVNGTSYKVVSVAANAFKGNKNITSVTIGSNVTSIGSKAFYKCTALKTVTLGKNVKTVGASAFYGCTKLTKFTAGAALTTIKTKAFSGCKVLKTVTLTKSTNLKTIGASAFNGCKKLTTLTICSDKLTKKTVKSALKGSSVKTVKVSSKKVSTYKKYFAKSNSGKKVTVKKK